uniref:Uncharacterized protein n=1 Tax=Caenorhabditis japonica TaxID=281687 RepID=A0A8R1IG38_CAEJA
MAHGSAKPTGRPRILNDQDERSVVRWVSNTLVFLKFVTCKTNSMDYQDTLQKGIVPFFNCGNRKKTHVFQQDNAAKLSGSNYIKSKDEQNK